MIHMNDIASGDGTGPGDTQDWMCGPFGFWPLTFPWTGAPRDRDGATAA